jgi:hypothetical protein
MELPRTNASKEVQTEDIASYNHAKLTYRLGKSFSRYDTQYDILPKLEFAKQRGTLCEAARFWVI